jgi:replicative DNA helicase
MDGRTMIDNNESAIQAEQSVIGSLLMLGSPDSQLVIKTMGMLKVGSFYKLYHKQIFKSIKALFVMGENIDSLTVEVQCKKQGNHDDDLFMYLAQAINNTPSSSNILGYSKIVRECSIERFANQKLQDLLGMFNDTSTGDVYQRLGLLETAITDISSIGMRNDNGGLKHINEAAVKWLDNIDEIHASGFDKNKLTTGIESIDDILGVKGMVRGSLVGVAARPKMGKTAFMSLMINHISLDLKLPVATFSMEMNSEEMFERGLSSRTTVDPAEFYKKEVRNEIMGRMDTACTEFSNSNLYIDDGTSLSLEHIKRESRKLRSENGELGAIFIDYLTLMEAEKAERNDLAYGKITKGLTNLAKELNCVVVLLLQLNRNLESRPDKKPIPSDCKDTGQIEQDVSLLIMLYKESVYDDTVHMPGFTEAIVRLNRKGGTGTGFVDMRQGFHVPMSLEEGAKVLNIRDQTKADAAEEKSSKTTYKRK